MVLLSSSISLLIFLSSSSIAKKVVFEAPTIILDYMFLLSILSVLVSQILQLLFGAYTFKIAMSSWWTDLFIIM